MEYVLKMVTNLKYLNGLDVDREELELDEEEEQRPLQVTMKDTNIATA